MRHFLEDDPYITEIYTGMTKLIQRTNVPVLCWMVLIILIVALTLIFMQEDVPVCVCV